jgi:hypothetical protein
MPASQLEPGLVAVATAILAGLDVEPILSHVLSLEDEPGTTDTTTDMAFRDRAKVKRAARLASRLIVPDRRTSEGRSTGPAGEWTRRTTPARQAAYLLNAARRLAVDQPDMTAERRYLAQHLAAETARVQAAIEVDRLSSEFGRVLGWKAEQDELTTPGCRAAHGQNFEAAFPPFIEGAPAYPGTPHGGACVTGETQVEARGVRASMSRPYSGEVVCIELASGRRLTITPNHPVLVERGWLAAGLLKAGDHVVGGSFGERGMAAVDEHDDYGPTGIEQVIKARAIADGMLARRVPVAAEDFHGDGSNGDVDVVRTDSLLHDGTQTPSRQPSGEHALGSVRTSLTLPGKGALDVLGSDLFGRLALNGGCDPRALLGRHLASARGSVRGSSVAPVLLWRAVSHRETVGLRLAPDCYRGLDEDSADRGTRNAVLSGQGVLGCPRVIGSDDRLGRQVDPVPPTGRDGWAGRTLEIPSPDGAGKMGLADPTSLSRLRNGCTMDVKIDRVVHLSRSQFTGHVYNLETVEGWYIASGIVVHNCRCRAVAPWPQASLLAAGGLPARESS